MTALRIASWNLQGRSGDAAARLGTMVKDQGGADLVLLQEASALGLDEFCHAADLDWSVHIADLVPDLLHIRGRAGGTAPDGSEYPRARCVAIAGRGTPLRSPTAFPDLPLPEKVLAGWTDVGGERTTLVSYHAPTGVQHQEKKAEQAVRLARWLRRLDGPTVFAGDFNTPESDPPDFARVRTHWHSGHPDLDGAPGDDLLVGPTPVHGLRDALRTYLAAHPEELATIRAQSPGGPLAVSYCTGSDGQRHHRYDAVWLSPHFDVESVTYLYREALEAGTDHALVLVEASLRDAA